MSLGAPGGRFPLGFDGYDREAVDAAVEQFELSISETRAQIERTETSAAAADSRVQALEAMVSELEEGAPAGSWLSGKADEFIDRAEEIGRELRSHVLSEAEAEREELKQTREVAESARAQAAEVVAKAQRDRDELGRMVEESRRQIDQVIQASKIMADKRAQAAWEKAQDRLRGPVVELERFRDQQRTMLKEVMELQELVDTSWRRAIDG